MTFEHPITTFGLTPHKMQLDLGRISLKCVRVCSRFGPCRSLFLEAFFVPQGKRFRSAPSSVIFSRFSPFFCPHSPILLPSIPKDFDINRSFISISTKYLSFIHSSIFCHCPLNRTGMLFKENETKIKQIHVQS